MRTCSSTVKTIVGLLVAVAANASDPTVTPTDNGATSAVLGVLNWIPPGAFEMGSPTSEPGRGADESQHQVTLQSGYWMMEREVTQGMWRSVMGDNPAHFSSCGDGCPVEQVSWLDAVMFAERLS